MRASRFDDPEGLFHLVRSLAHVGEVDAALEVFADVVARGKTARSGGILLVQQVITPQGDLDIFVRVGPSYNFV